MPTKYNSQFNNKAIIMIDDAAIIVEQIEANTLYSRKKNYIWIYENTVIECNKQVLELIRQQRLSDYKRSATININGEDINVTRITRHALNRNKKENKTHKTNNDSFFKKSFIVNNKAILNFYDAPTKVGKQRPVHYI